MPATIIIPKTAALVCVECDALALCGSNGASVTESELCACDFRTCETCGDTVCLDCVSTHEHNLND